MGKYTVYGKDADKKIQAQLDTICKVIVEKLNPISIILIGGFGRGEGSIIHKKNKFIPINDYDIYAITSRTYPTSIIEETSRLATEAIGKKCINFFNFKEDLAYSIENTFYADIRVMTLEQLKKIPPFLKYFDMKYGSKVIYGEDVLKQMPDITLNDIPSPEGFRFLLNRISLMVMHFSPEFISSPSDSDKERIINFNMKAALSCAEALLFYSKKYTASYKQRSNTLKKTFKYDFPDLFSIIPGLPKIVHKYTMQKIKPDYASIKDYISDWFKIRDYSTEISKFLLYEYTSKKPNDVFQIAKILNKNYSKKYLEGYIKSKYNIKSRILLLALNPLASIVLNLLFIKRVYSSNNGFTLGPLIHPFVAPDMKIFAAGFLIINSLNKDKTLNKEMFTKSRKYLHQVFPDNKKIYEELNWEGIRELYGTLFNLYGFQKII
ncbi:MAG: hypothetical protein ACP5OG_00980 [Candidatus Nanoarchaeia archaeon]